MATYGMIPAQQGSPFGFGGGMFGLIGGVGPAWNYSFNTAMDTANKWYNLQNRVMLDQYAVPAQAATYDNTLQHQATGAVYNDTKKDIMQWLATTQQNALTDQVMQALGVQGNTTYPATQAIVPPQQQQLQYAQLQPQSNAAYGPLQTQQNIANKLGYNPAFYQLGTQQFTFGGQ